MDLVQNSKSSVGVSYVNSAETASHAFDCVGFDAVSIDAIVQTNEETTAPAVVKFETSDDNTTFATVTGLIQGTDYTPAGVASTADANVTRFDVSLKGLERYVKVSVTPSGDVGTNDATVVVAARLHKAEEGINSAARAGVEARAVK
jgi:hypothetical protein